MAWWGVVVGLCIEVGHRVQLPPCTQSLGATFGSENFNFYTLIAMNLGKPM